MSIQIHPVTLTEHGPERRKDMMAFLDGDLSVDHVLGKQCPGSDDTSGGRAQRKRRVQILQDLIREQMLRQIHSVDMLLRLYDPPYISVGTVGQPLIDHPVIEIVSFVIQGPHK